MNIFTNREIKRLFLAIGAVMAGFLLLSQLINWFVYEKFVLIQIVLSLVTTIGVMLICLRYFRKQNAIMEMAVSQINTYIEGGTDARIECDSEGELYKLFHTVNTLAAVLNAHAENEQRSKEFLKSTISDISHQLKTPLAALNIYNGLLQGESEELPAVKEFVTLSEQELDRIDTLVQSLLKITRLDAGSIVIEKSAEHVADMMSDIQRYFAFRTKQERKQITLSGEDDITLCCDRVWMIEAVSNLVKNALDHTEAGGCIQIEWKQFPSATQIAVTDDGSGIHQEDIHHIFKRFYRSRFSKDRQGIGLGLPLSKAIVEAHDGTITVNSVFGQGSTFVIHILNTTIL